MKTVLLLSVVTIHALATGTSCKDEEDSSLVQAAPFRSLRKVLPTSFGKVNDTATSRSLLQQKPATAEAASVKTAAKPAKQAAAPPKAASVKTAAKPAKQAAAPPKAASVKTAAKPVKEAAASVKTAAKPAKEAAAPPKAASVKTAAKPAKEAAAQPKAASVKTAEKPVATLPEAPSDKTAEQPAATSPEAPSDKTAEQPADTPPEAPSEKTAEQPAATTPGTPSDKTAEQPAATPPEAPSEKTAEQPAATPPEAPSEKTAEQPAATPPGAEQPAATPPEAPSEKTTEQPVATSPEAPSDKTAEQPAATPPGAPSEKTTEQPVATPPEAPSDKTAEQPAATPPEAPSDKTAEQPETGIAEGSNGSGSGTGNMSVPAAKANQTAQPLVPLPSEPALDSSTRVVEIVVPNANNSHAVIRIRNPDAIDIEDVNVTNPVASLRSKANLPLKALAIHRVPTTIYSKNDSFDGLRHFRLQVESFDTMNSSVEEYATVSKDALLEMIKALRRASPICHNWSQARVEKNDMLEQEEALMSKTDDLSKSLERVVQGSVAASGLEVAKAAQKILENRQIWEAHANENLLLRQQAKKSVNQLAIELLGAVRHGITSLKTSAVASKVKVNLTKVREEFFAALDFGKGSVLSVSQMNIELDDLEKAINVSANNLTLSISLSANLVQDAVLKTNASKRLNSAVDMKENLTSLLYERVHLAENISHDTSRLPPLAVGATMDLSVGTAALVISASQAENLAEQLQVIDSSIQEIYQETLETDVHMKLKGLTLQKTLREALRTCAEGLRLVRLSGKEVNSSLAEIFRNVHGIYGNASSPIESLRKPGELQSVTKLSTLHTNISVHNASAPVHNDSAPVRLSEQRRQFPEAEDAKEVPWTLPDDPKTADTSTTLLFGVPITPQVLPSKESRLLPNLLIASAMSLFLILGSVLLWIVSA